MANKIKITKEQLAVWKKEYGNYYVLNVSGYKGYLKPVTRPVIRYALSIMGTDPLGSDEHILENCWLGGDEIIKTDLSLLLSARQQMSLLFDLKKASLAKH